MFIHRNQNTIKHLIHAYLYCAYLVLGGFVFKKHRRSIYTILNNKHTHPMPPALIPSASISCYIPNTTTISLTELNAADENVSITELTIIAAITKVTNPQKSIKIGTFDGRTTLNLAINQEMNSSIITIDLPQDDVHSTKMRLEPADIKYINKSISGSKFSTERNSAQIIQLYGDSATYDFSDHINSIDIMFIDGSHSYEYVINDSQIALFLVRKGGIILWHDYNTPHWPGVTLALNSLYKNYDDFKNIKHIENTSLCILQR